MKNKEEKKQKNKNCSIKCLMKYKKKLKILFATKFYFILLRLSDCNSTI